MACHTVNLPYMALSLGYPPSRFGEEWRYQSETYPSWATVTYEFPVPALAPRHADLVRRCKERQVSLSPASLFPDKGLSPSDSGSILVGSTWRMYSPNDYGAKQVIWPKDDFKNLTVPELCSLATSTRDIDTNQKREWVQAIRAGKPSIALSNFDYAATLTESMLLGNVAVRSGQTIDYNPETGEIAGSSEASRYLKPYFRKGWEI